MNTKTKDIRVGPVHHYNRRTKACLQDLLGIVGREKKTGQQHEILKRECKKAMDVHSKLSMLQLPGKRKHDESQYSVSNNDESYPRNATNGHNTNNYDGGKGNENCKKKYRRARLQSKPGFTARGQKRIFISHKYVDRSFELHPVFVDNDDSLFEDYFRRQIEQKKKLEAGLNDITDASGDNDNQVSNGSNEKKCVSTADGDRKYNPAGGDKNCNVDFSVGGDKNCEVNVEAQDVNGAVEDSNGGNEKKEINVSFIDHFCY